VTVDRNAVSNLIACF